MNGDFTRDTFDAAKHFSRVLMQQGRVQLDADWNEQTSILLRYLRILAADILGPYAGPADAMGFDLITKGPNANARIDAIEPDPTRADALKKRVTDGDVVIGTGRYYVHGVLVENLRAITYTEQPGYPFSEETTLDNLQNKALFAYLDVWERHITYVQDDRIREVALGGPDTCTRAQVVWQLKALLRPDNVEQFDCTSLEGLLARDAAPPPGTGASRQAAHRAVRDFTRLALSRRRESALPGGSAPGRCCRDGHDRRDLQMVAGQRLGRVPDRFAFRHHGRRREPGPG